MPWWVAFVLIIAGICSAVPFLYARKLAREDGDAERAPIWFGGVANLYLVPRILRKHAEQGDYWAARARLVFCVGAVIAPVLIAGLAVHDLWFR